MTKTKLKRIYIYIYILVIFYAVVATYGFAKAEGSQNYNAGTQGVRSSLTARSNVFYVYMNVGEEMHIGTSVYQNNDYDIQVIDPNGNTTNYDVTKLSNGFIENREQELAGPNILSSGGYSPITVASNKDGIYQVVMLGNKNPVIERDGCGVLIYENWDIDAECISYTIPAWDITVTNTSHNKVDGRVFTSDMGFGASPVRLFDAPVYSSLFVLTGDGFQYKVYLNGARPFSYHIRSDNVGNIVNNKSAYSSYKSDATGFTLFTRRDFLQTAEGFQRNRLFFNKPDGDLLSYLGLPSNGEPQTIDITNFRFTGTNSNNDTAYVGLGGTFSFDSNVAKRKYRLSLIFPNGKNIIKEESLKTNNTITWDGKDSEGNIVEAGTNFLAKLEINPGEMHISLDDFEWIENGIIFQRLNGSASNRFIIHYDHSHKIVDGYSNNMDRINTENNSLTYITPSLIMHDGWLVNSEDYSQRFLKGASDQSAGVDSSGGASNTDNFFSDTKFLDFWSLDDGAKVDLSVSVIVTKGNKTLSINKSWNDNDNKYALRPTSVIIDAFPENSNTSAGNCTADSSNSWSCTIIDLPIYDNSGNEIQYVIKERNALKTYSAESVTVSPGSESVEITNTLVTKNIEVTKKWAGDRDNLFGTRPQQITFDAYWDDTVYGSCSAQAQDNWECSISNLAVYDASGEAISYMIKERNVPKAYTADEPVISGETNKAGTLTNTLITKDLSVSKMWEDQDNKYKMRPENLEFDLYLGDEIKDSCAATADTSWKCTFSGLPVYDALGLEQNYTVKENTIPKGYTTEDVVVSGKDSKTASVINKLITKDITVIKNWDDNSDHDHKRPQSIILELYQDSELFSTAMLTAAENTLSENVWTYIFRDIPKQNKNGNEAVYTIKELPAD